MSMPVVRSGEYRTGIVPKDGQTRGCPLRPVPSEKICRATFALLEPPDARPENCPSGGVVGVVAEGRPSTKDSRIRTEIAATGTCGRNRLVELAVKPTNRGMTFSGSDEIGRAHV